MEANETPRTVLERNQAILLALRGILKDDVLSPQKREEYVKLASTTERIIQALQADSQAPPPIKNISTTPVALNGAAFGAALAVLRICWSWTAWSGYRLSPFNSDTQLLYAYTVFWYAVAGAVIFVVARNVLNSITWR